MVTEMTELPRGTSKKECGELFHFLKRLGFSDKAIRQVLLAANQSRWHKEENSIQGWIGKWGGHWPAVFRGGSRVKMDEDGNRISKQDAVLAVVRANEEAFKAGLRLDPITKWEDLLVTAEELQFSPKSLAAGVSDLVRNSKLEKDGRGKKMRLWLLHTKPEVRPKPELPYWEAAFK